MKKRVFCAALGVAFALTPPVLNLRVARAADTPWDITGTLSESCSCSVPCSCNFGESPSPHSFCWAIAAFTIDKGNYGDTQLDGLRVASSQGAKGMVFFIDPRADKEQSAALQSIARTIWVKALKANGITDLKKVPPGYGLLGVKTARIEHTFDDKKNHVLIENMGRFDADYIIGSNGKPIGVENNWSINISDNLKGKAKILRYHDEFGNRYDFKGVNANQGKFDWSDSTPYYFR